MYEERSDVVTPPDDTVLWRYMNLEKYLDLLGRKELFFARADNLGDPYEGSLPRATLERYQAQMAIRNQQGETDLSPTTGLEDVQYHTKFTFISSWHGSADESDAMWKLYAARDSGAAVQTTVGRLKAVLGNPADDNYVIGKVTYVNYNTDIISLDTYLSLFLHKRHTFEHEHEVRAIVVRSPPMKTLPDGTQRQDWEREMHEVVRLPIEPKGLIESLAVAPFAEDWYLAVVKDITDRYGIQVEVLRSELARPPLWS